MQKVTVRFLGHDRSVEVPAGCSCLDAVRAAGFNLPSDCGGKGTCGKCKVQVAGTAGSPLAAEQRLLSAAELDANWRLACLRQVTEDTVLRLWTAPGDINTKRLTQTKLEEPLEPAVQKQFVILPEPGMTDTRSDESRLRDALPSLGSISPSWLNRLPALLRQAAFKVTAVTVADRLTAFEAGDTTDTLFGVAFDVGTTTIAGYLVDLRQGIILASHAVHNPQGHFGADVVSRILHAQTESGLAELQQAVVGGLNSVVNCLLSAAAIERESVYEAVCVGNTAMSHLLLGINPRYLGASPYLPVFTGMLTTAAADIGLHIAGDGVITLLPNIAGFVGSDTVAVMLAAQIDEQPGNCLAVDLGTNGELALKTQNGIWTASTAAGPAFEGVNLRSGMRATAGAISRIHVSGQSIDIETIAGAKPVGLCGSGLISAAAALLQAGVIEPSGRLLDRAEVTQFAPRLAEQLCEGETGVEFVLVPAVDSANGQDIVLSQNDIRELQLAKGAIRAGILALLRQSGCESGFDRVLLTGAFGSQADTDSILAIGLMPDISRESIVLQANAAGYGACLALVSVAQRRKAAALARSAGHIELANQPDFQTDFIQSLNFPGQAGQR